jgi:hypothetical protein
MLDTLYPSSIQEWNCLWRKSSRRVKSPMPGLPHLSVSHGYLSCTNTDDGLHTHRSMATLFTHLSDKRCLYLVSYDEFIQRFWTNCDPFWKVRTPILHPSVVPQKFAKSGLGILHTLLAVMFVHGKHESIVLKLISLKTSRCIVCNRSHFVCSLILTTSANGIYN